MHLMESPLEIDLAKLSGLSIEKYQTFVMTMNSNIDNSPCGAITLTVRYFNLIWYILSQPSLSYMQILFNSLSFSCAI